MIALQGHDVDMSDTVKILKLSIERFRGIQVMEWNPAPGMNIILGGGDTGKTTILDAIALLFSPSNALVLSEADYWQRKVDAEFRIQAVVELSPDSEISHQQKFAWPWEWDGTDAICPADGDVEPELPATSKRPVYRLQVRGTSDLEVNWEIVQPNDETDHLSAAVRRNIGVVRLGGDDRNDRDLRLVYGSALERLLGDKSLRAKIGQSVSGIDIKANLGAQAKDALGQLDKTLKEEALPNKLDLGLTSSQGLSIGPLIGLMAERTEGIALPLASWGAGTRRMTALQIAAASEAKSSLVVIDEIERGLEPYRLRKLVHSLQERRMQVFVTTHSAVTIRSADQASLWYLDSGGSIGELPRKKIAMQQKRDPETFLSRLSIIAEGPTEVGFVSVLLDLAVDGSVADHGIRVCDGQGNPATLDLLEAMAHGGVIFCGFADNEGQSSGRWATLKMNMSDRLFQWASGCTEENIIQLVEEPLLGPLIDHPDPGKKAERLVTLRERLNIEEKSLDAIRAAAPDLRALIIAASTGRKEGAPEGEERNWGRHGGRWFKSEGGGCELAQKMFALGVWPSVRDQLLPFCNSVRAFLGQGAISDIDHER